MKGDMEVERIDIEEADWGRKNANRRKALILGDEQGTNEAIFAPNESRNCHQSPAVFHGGDTEGD